MKQPLTRNSADEEQVRAAGEKEKRNSEREVDDLRVVLNTPSGRRFFWKLMGDCGVFTGSFTGNSETFWREGRRAVGLELLLRLNTHFPEHYLTMIQESREQA